MCVVRPSQRHFHLIAKEVLMNVLLKTMVCACVIAVGASAESDSATAVTMVKKAADFFKANGLAKTIAAINDSSGQFVKGELYVFAYDSVAVMMAHPKNPKLIGKNLLETPDVDGKLFRKEIVEVAKAKGNGWVPYKYKNPVSGAIEPKTTYLMKAGPLVLCCGIYQN